MEEASTIGQRSLAGEATQLIPLMPQVHLLVTREEEVAGGDEVCVDDDLLPLPAPFLPRLSEEDRDPPPLPQW